MQYVVLVHRMQTEAYLDEPVQDLVLPKAATGARLLLDAVAEVAPVAVRHDYTKLVSTFCKKRIFEPNDVRVRQPLHKLHLMPARFPLFLRYVRQLDALHAVVFLFLRMAHQIDFPKGPLPNRPNNLVLFNTHNTSLTFLFSFSSV